MERGVGVAGGGGEGCVGGGGERDLVLHCYWYLNIMQSDVI